MYNRDACLKHIPNQYNLVLIASARARQLCHGASPLVKTGDKVPFLTVALKEIEAGLINETVLKKSEK